MLERLGVQNEWRDKSKLAFAKLQKLLDPSYKFDFADPGHGRQPAPAPPPPTDPAPPAGRPGARTGRRAGRDPKPTDGPSTGSRATRFCSLRPAPAQPDV